ncbi:MAG: hypothetical protein E6L02_08100 [Thaumarchaeota archaeon]|nr:MAG: hypothetical protein E6L02_08100 [Nitrososphaerota archaeon]
MEEHLNKTEAVLNKTSEKVSDKTAPMIQEAQQQINEAQQQINVAQQQIQKALVQSPSQTEVKDAITQTHEAQQQVQEAKQQIQVTADQLINTEKDLKKPGDEIKQIATQISENNQTTQYGQWKGNNETITVQVQGPDGKPFDIQPQVEQILEGKYNITLSSTRDAKPGIYTVKTILIKDGKTYTTQDQFAWGLVSLNTKKSIYRPGETADFVIVVLDNGGHPVCDSNISMNITNPNSQTTTLSSGNGIMPNIKCGLYDASFTTTSEGNYTIGVSAQNPSGTANFSTSFLVQNSYAFDIIRTADSKIDPVNDTNSFNVQIDIGSYVKTDSVKIQEFVPSVFNVTTDAKVETLDDTKILTWDKDLISNQTSIQYSYSVPLEFPKLYALGPVQITYDNNKTFNEARPWFVAVDPESGFHKGSGVVIPLGVDTTIATVKPAVTASDNKFIIAAFYWKIGTSVTNRTKIQANDLKLIGPTGRIATNVQGYNLGTGGFTNMSTTILIANDTSHTTASPTYTLTAKTSAANTVGSGQIIVISNATQMGSIKIS